MTDLGAGAAYNLNIHGTVIGDSFLWHGGVRTALTALLPANSGWSSLEGRDINDHGEIVGTGVHQGNTRAFLNVAVDLWALAAARGQLPIRSDRGQPFRS